MIEDEDYGTPERRVRCADCGVYFWSEVRDVRQSLDGWTISEAWPKHETCEECRQEGEAKDEFAGSVR